ncbi:MAG: hypothetical protein ACM3O9_05635 [Methylocystaceae bacterium]
MREIRHYNLIFPLIITIFLPPFIIIPLVGNLLIDGMVYYILLHQLTRLPKFPQLVRMVLPAWIIGFVADILGVTLLIAASELLPLNLDLIGIWTNIPTIIIVVLVIMLVGFIIYRLNLWLLWRQGIELEICIIIALAMGIVTAPWFFLIPTTWFKALMSTL